MNNQVVARGKPVVGQRLFRLNVGNNARHVPSVLTPVIVKTCGRKYFTVARENSDYAMETRHLVDGWHHDNGGYCAGFALYASEQELADERCRYDLITKIRAAFACGGDRFDLNKLRAVEAALWPSDKADHPSA